MSVVGIDLGTTNTVVACVRSGRVHVLADEDGRTLLPSVVSFHPNGEVLVGQAAKERRVVDAKNTIASVKRLIGRSWRSPEVSTARQRFPFELREGPGQGPLVAARGQDYTLPEISAFVLRKARQIAEAAMGEPVERAVITVPANFNELQRAATKVAGRVAGLEVMRILNEPTAAALAYGLGRTEKARVAVYDFGGGTFDCTLLDLSGNVFEVLATAGDSFLGGDDVDATIAERMADAFLLQYRVDPREDPQAYERLKVAAEQLKVQLTSDTTAQVRLREVAFGVGGAHLDLAFGLSRLEFEALAKPLVARTLKVTEDALVLAGLPPQSFDRVILVGGSTRMPIVAQAVERFFDRTPLCTMNPDEVVAVGAAIQAAALAEAERRRSVPPPPMPAAPGRVKTAPGGVGRDTFRERMPSQPTFGQLPPVGPARARMASRPDTGEVRPAVVRAAIPTTPGSGPPPQGTSSAPPEVVPGVPAAALPLGRVTMRLPGLEEAPSLGTVDTQKLPDSAGRNPALVTPRLPDLARAESKNTNRIRDVAPMTSRTAVAPPPPALPSFDDDVTASPGVEPSLDVTALAPPMDRPSNLGAPPVKPFPSVQAKEPRTAPGVGGPSSAPPAPAPRLDTADSGLLTLPGVVHGEGVGSGPPAAVPRAPRGEIHTLPGAPTAGTLEALRGAGPAPARDEITEVAPPPVAAGAPVALGAIPGSAVPAVHPSVRPPSLYPPSSPPEAGHRSSSRMPAARPPPPVLVDVTPRALVVETVGGFCDVVIPRNARIPCECTRGFATSSDNQTVVRVRVGQGEAELFGNNTYLGELELKSLRACRRGEVTITVHFELDASGTLQVRATDDVTGQATEATIQLVGIANEAAILEMVERQSMHRIAKERQHLNPGEGSGPGEPS